MRPLPRLDDTCNSILFLESISMKKSDPKTRLHDRSHANDLELNFIKLNIQHFIRLKLCEPFWQLRFYLNGLRAEPAWLIAILTSGKKLFCSPNKMNSTHSLLDLLVWKRQKHSNVFLVCTFFSLPRLGSRAVEDVRHALFVRQLNIEKRQFIRRGKLGTAKLFCIGTRGKNNVK